MEKFGATSFHFDSRYVNMLRKQNLENHSSSGWKGLGILLLIRNDTCLASTQNAMRSEPTRVVFTYLRSKKQNKQHCNCLALFSPSLVLSLSHKFVKHSLITQVPLETCHVEICTLTTTTCHHSSIGSDAVSQRTVVDNAYIVPLQIATTPISLRSLVKATLGKGLVCISAVLSPLSTLTASPPVRSREALTKPRQTR